MRHGRAPGARARGGFRAGRSRPRAHAYRPQRQPGRDRERRAQTFDCRLANFDGAALGANVADALLDEPRNLHLLQDHGRRRHDGDAGTGGADTGNVDVAQTHGPPRILRVAGGDIDDDAGGDVLVGQNRCEHIVTVDGDGFYDGDGAVSAAVDAIDDAVELVNYAKSKGQELSFASAIDMGGNAGRVAAAPLQTQVVEQAN